jgi:hypothetical protein
MTSTSNPTITNRLVRGILAAAAASILLTGTAAAQNDGNVSMSAGTDIVNQYYFRGIIQETSGFIMQPFLDASISVGAASITAGTWSSLHSVGGEGFAGAPQSFYETDFYAGIGGAAGPVGLDLTYTAYMSPRGSWGTTKEIALGLSVDNVAAPYATFAFETAGGADGYDKGSYLELGIEPAAPLDDAPVGLSFPVTLGLSLNNYYQYGVEVDDVVEVMPGGSFGFFSVGASLGIPLNVAEEFGAWELALGVNALMLGEGAKAIDGGDSSTKIIATFGLSVGY